MSSAILMKKLPHILTCLFCFLLILGCSKEELRRENDVVVDSVAANTSENKQIKEPRFDNYSYYRSRIIKYVYVTNRNGTEIKEQADSSSKSIGSYSYGDKLEVIEIADNWLGVLDNKGDKGWEKFYVLKSSTDSIEQIKLIDLDLNIVSSIDLNQNKVIEIHQNDFLGFELIDSILFENKKLTTANFLISDTTIHRKKDGIITLNCLNQKKRVKDKPSGLEDVETYEYVGQFDFLNKYLIKGSYYESHNYIFIDKMTCKKTQTFIEFPYISANKKYIICVYSNPYEQTGDVELYSIIDNQTKVIYKANFKKWMPLTTNPQMFWSDDGYFYCAVVNSKVFWKASGHQNDNCQYMRIKIL